MEKVVLIAYNGELMCFAHVLMYAVDLDAKGYEVKMIIEGSATGLIGDLNIPGRPFANFYSQVKEKGLLTCICKACAQKMGTLAEAEKQGLNIAGDMYGHPSVDAYLQDGARILTF